MVDVLIVDDHPIVREGIKQILSAQPDITVADEATGGREAMEKIRNGSFDVVVLDISMPGENGIEVLKRIRSESPETRVLVLSIYPEEQFAIRCLKGGASGYLNKDIATEELGEAIRQVAAGRRYVTSGTGERLANELFHAAGKMPHEALSDREFQVMCEIGKGKTATEIASEMKLSVKTISTYRARILDKMHMHSSAQITAYAVRNDLV
jgi:DNA-binding NarL/FixJ family response regulator